jgi:hypothetical protein
MRHDRIISAVPRFARAGWGRKLRRYLYLYVIHPPIDRPFLPTDDP